MSSLNAVAICCSTVGWLAFHPKRPSTRRPVTASGTRFSTGDAITVEILGIRRRDNIRGIDGFEQTQSGESAPASEAIAFELRDAAAPQSGSCPSIRRPGVETEVPSAIATDRSA